MIVHAPKLAALYSNASIDYIRDNVREYALHDALLLHDREHPDFHLHDSLVSGRVERERVESKCVLLNARSLKNKLDEFQTEIIVGHDYPCVVGVTETWLDSSIPNNIFQCKNLYDVFRKDRNLNGGGVAILSKT